MKDIYCSYYTNSNSITNYMVKRLDISHSDLILEPSAGEGIFIDEILKNRCDVHVDALDINPESIAILEKKYEKSELVTVRKTDTLLDEQLDSYGMQQLWLKETDTLLDNQLDYFGQIGGHYDKVIGNPPYGAWQDYEKRDVLKKKYSGHYVKETYSLFLLRCMSVLKMRGRLSFIIPDTFMFLNMHSKLRDVLLTRSKIDEILIFPSKFFPGVSFGYSNLSIITLERCEKGEALRNDFRVVQGFQSPEEFGLMFDQHELPKHIKVIHLNQKDILDNDNHRFVLAQTEQKLMLNSVQNRLGDVADVVTGFYTGDNIRFIKARDESVKGSKNYEKINSKEVFECESLEGIPNIEVGYIPYVKSASRRRYLRDEDEWYVRWDSATIEFYNSNKKSRFQNSSFYFKSGVAIPMVKSKSIRAFMMDHRVFDQSIVGIFPRDKTKLYYLLALMNSDVINEYIHIINPTANNSANYVKQLPYIESDAETLAKINELVDRLLDYQKQEEFKKADNIHEQLNEIINVVYNREQQELAV